MPMPPPNITGSLHLGHSLFLTIQDTIIRNKRNQGFDTLWIPGFDHAGIATENKISQHMSENNMTFEESSKIIIDKNKEIIKSQIQKMGASCDWSKKQYTLSKSHSKAVIRAYNSLKEKNLIYEKDNQLYIKTNLMASELLQAIENKQIKIIPETKKNRLLNFLRNNKDWCISRQIRFGHKIPDREDVFDTWFSSSLWPITTLGWPEETEDYERYYPSDLIETAEDILFFWCARMLMICKTLTDIYPFHTIYLHGIITDSDGKKMSKSLGNGIDPLEIIETHGCDTLRFALLETCNHSNHHKFNENSVIPAKKLINKIWQANNFLTNIEPNSKLHAKTLNIIDKNNEICNQITKHINEFNFNKACFTFRKYFKHEFCDIHIEEIKKNKSKENIIELEKCFKNLMVSINPVIPFITEEILDRGYPWVADDL